MSEIHPAAQEFIDDLLDPENQAKQGIGRLQPSDGTFCCLGMLCRVAERHGIEVERTDDDDDDDDCAYATGLIGGFTLSGQPAVLDWARDIGLAPNVCGNGLLGYDATAANDEYRLSFDKIGRDLAARLAR